MPVFEIVLNETKVNLPLPTKEELLKNPALKPRYFAGIFESILNTAMQSKFPGGVQGANLRTLNRVYMKLDMSDDGSIDLEQAELDFLKDLFLSDQTAMPPQLVRAFSLYQSQVEDLVRKS